jgi:hypothetical protein
VQLPPAISCCTKHAPVAKSNAQMNEQRALPSHVVQLHPAVSRIIERGPAAESSAHWNDVIDEHC